ncbi:MAG: hypothetical protein N2578_02935 [Bdellovibrionaceae bacterium]|nr:hypothetical protein [Pseudobdellovibrionaceae bacterium]
MFERFGKEEASKSQNDPKPINSNSAGVVHQITTNDSYKVSLRVGRKEGSQSVHTTAAGYKVSLTIRPEVE